MHFLINCTRYDDLRKSLFDLAVTNNPHFMQYSDEQKFNWLLSNENIEHTKHLAKYIESSLKLRSK